MGISGGTCPPCPLFPTPLTAGLAGDLLLQILPRLLDYFITPGVDQRIQTHVGVAERLEYRHD